ncbi:MAG: hypothetical protein BAJALOKI2v1_110047 [Promethearchaeota archaeon]|nr:MAG: hypothetical protein BAJALOKI2v1_110047 [Candidatus Lokiarchaeota archaeon]
MLINIRSISKSFFLKGRKKSDSNPKSLKPQTIIARIEIIVQLFLMNEFIRKSFY